MNVPLGKSLYGNMTDPPDRPASQPIQRRQPRRPPTITLTEIFLYLSLMIIINYQHHIGTLTELSILKPNSLKKLNITFHQY